MGVEDKIFHEKTKFTGHSSTNPNPTPQKVLEGKFQHNDEKNASKATPEIVSHMQNQENRHTHTIIHHHNQQ